MMRIDDVPEAVSRLSKELPRFSDGRIDYHTAKEAPVLNVFVMYDQKLLLLKRSDKVGWLKGRWHIVAGFLDDERTLREKVLEELIDETHIDDSYIASMHTVEPYQDISESKTWLVYPVLVNLLREPKIVLDWEAIEYKWIDPKTLASYDVIPNVLRMYDLLTRL